MMKLTAAIFCSAAVLGGLLAFVNQPVKADTCAPGDQVQANGQPADQADLAVKSQRGWLYPASYTPAQAGQIAAEDNTNVSSKVNTYIDQQHLPYKGVQTEPTTFTPVIHYRYGRPEGIVVHETAQPGVSAQQDAAAFRNHWQRRQTYVHAFVDHNGVIQIHPTNLGVYGAGYFANQRFIQVELCEESNFRDFAQGVQNDATYIAGLLHQYGLQPVLTTQFNRQGTIWSHHDVSLYLGNTNHVDPDGYFARFGYSMGQFFNLIKERYDEQVIQKLDELAVKIVYHGRGQVAVWTSPRHGHNIGKYLKPGTVWRAFGKMPGSNGRLWFNLGGQQWVDGHYARPVKLAQILKISYAGRGKVAVWTSPFVGHRLTGQYLAKGSRWRFFQVATGLDHQNWYNLGKNEWIPAKYVLL